MAAEYSKNIEIDVELVKDQITAWENSYEANNQRGEESIRFAMSGEQWEADVLGERESSNKECLTFNIMQKHMRKLDAQLKEIEFSLQLYSKNEGANLGETNTFKILLDHIVLSKGIIETLAEAAKKCAQYGYSFVEVNFEQDNNETLCSSPVIRTHKDPSVAFWDSNAQRPTKTDGRFCGIKKTLSEDEFLEKYPDSASETSLKKENNKVIDYWFKRRESAIFLALKGGVYKRKDLINDDDELATKEDTEDAKGALYNKELVKKGKIDCIYFCRICNDDVIVHAKKFPTDRLPMPYHKGFTIWTKDGDETYPFTYAMHGAQQLLNYAQSQLATMIKNSSGRLIIWDHQHVSQLTAEKLDDVKNINGIEGSIDVNLAGAQVEPIILQPTDIPFALMEFVGSIKSLADDIAGSYIDVQNSDQTIVSGKAMQEFTESMMVMQIGFMADHIDFVKEVCSIVQSMIPHLYTEQRLLVVSQKDGTATPVMINKYIPETQTIQNNIRDLNDSFIYTITAGPSTKMQKQNALKNLQTVIAADPNWIQYYGDIYARNLDFSDAEEFERRMVARIDPNLVAYSQNKITLKNLLSSQQQKQNGQAQMAQQVQSLKMEEQQAKNAKLQNEAQAITTRIQNETLSTNADAQSKLANAANQAANTQINAQKVMGEQQQRATQQSLDESHLQYEREKSDDEHLEGMMGHAINLHDINQSAALSVNQLAQQQQQSYQQTAQPPQNNNEGN